MFKKINTTTKKKKKKTTNKKQTQFPRTNCLDSLLSQNTLLAKTTDRFCRFFPFHRCECHANKLKSRDHNIHVIQLLKVDP